MITKKGYVILLLGMLSGVLLLLGVSQAKSTLSVTGLITDSAGQPIPEVNVFATNTNTQVKYHTKTGKNGRFFFENLPAGVYDLRAVASGFVPALKKNIHVRVSATTSVDFKLKLKTTNPADIPSKVLQEAEALVAGVVGGIDKKSVFRYSARDAAHPTAHHPDWNTEEYDRIYENVFLDVLTNPLSTFSIDVDTASYSNIRRFINEHQFPYKDAVRIEEMINYFSYDYPLPKKQHPFSIYTEVSSCPWNPDHSLIHIGLQGKKLEAKKLPPSNLVFLLDVSGSMKPDNKLPLLQKAFKLLVNELEKNDRVSIVVYAGAAGLVLPSTSANQKETILAAIEKLHAGGSTAGGAGIKLAYRVAEENFIKDGNNRIILATDGDFNVGISSTSELVRMVEEKRKLGIFLTILGFGMGNYKDGRMEQLADKGNGNYFYIDNLLEAKKVFINDMRGTLFTIAKDVKLQIEFNPAKVKAYRLIGYENRILNKEDFADDTKDAGELGAGHTVTALYEIIPYGSSEEIPSVDELKYQENKISPAAFKSKDLLTLKLRYKNPDGDRSKLINHVLKDKTIVLAKTSENFKFSAAVAEFGMLLRESKFLGQSSFESILQLAQAGKGKDPFGYRAEFINLVEMCSLLETISKDN